MSVVQRALQRLEFLPPWLRWLEAAPLAVQEADRFARRAYLFYQLPCAALSACLYAAAKHLGWLASRPVIGLFLLLAGMVALAWPVYVARLALAARRGAAGATGNLAARLRAMAFVCFALSGLMALALAGMVGLFAVIAVAMSAR